MSALVASQARGQSGNHRYHLSQFGSSAEEVLSAFAPYCERFGLSKPIEEALGSPQARSSFLKKQEILMQPQSRG
jgi:hypothetical protein